MNSGDIFSIDENKCIIKNGQNLGYGSFSFKVSVSKATSKKEASTSIFGNIDPVWTKDEEKIVYSNVDNNESIISFIKTWVSANIDEVNLLDNVVGVEINFNKVFPKIIAIRRTEEILKEIKSLGGEF